MKKKKKPTAKDYCFYLLSRKDYTKKELKDKLVLKKYSGEEIEEVLKLLDENRYIDEDRYLKNYFNYLIVKKKSSKEIKYKMSIKGFKKESIEEIIRNLYTEENEINILEELVKKYNIRYEGKEHKREKIIKNLLMKGFSLDLILQIVGNANDN